MERFTKLLAVTWTGAALALMVTALAGPRIQFTLAMLALAVIAAAASAYSRYAMRIILAAAYVAPVIARTVRGGTPFAPNLVVWLVPLFGAMLPDLVRSGWRIPVRWRLPLVTAVLAVVATTPIVLLREAEFTPALVLRWPEWHWQGPVWPSLLAVWALYVAVSLVIGVLWLDWLCGRPHADFRGDVAVPLLVSGSLLVAVTLYQFFVDISFLNDTTYGRFGRAGGTLYDGNLSGILLAFWVAALLVHTHRRPYGLWLAVAGSAAGWLAVWATGSRTAFGLVAVVTAMALVGRVRVSQLSPLHVLGATGLCAVLAGALVLSGGRVAGPLSRMHDLLVLGSVGSPMVVVRELWNRNHYGEIATELIARFPWFGIGIGMFHSLGPELSGGRLLVPDNAQNWLRHVIVELGVVGSLGWIAWFIAFGWALVRRRRTLAPESRPSAWVLRGGLLGFGAVSMLGVPGQDALVGLTFWALAYQFMMLVEAPAERSAPPRPLAWVVAMVLAVAAAAGTLQVARTTLRPSHRFVNVPWPYSFGLGPVTDAAGGFRSGAERAVTLVDRTSPWMVVTVRRKAGVDGTVPIRVAVNGTIALKGQLSSELPLSGAIALHDAERRILVEVEAEDPRSGWGRLWRAPHEPYLIHWEFVDRRPEHVPITAASRLAW